MKLRSTLYRTARVLNDLHAIERGRVPQRIIRRTVYKHTFSLARLICKALGVSR